MTITGTSHRLATRRVAILNADVVAYSTMMARDAPATIASLHQNLRWVSDAVQRYGGRLIDAVGDNFMAQFAAEEDAVCCAALIQRREDLRNSGVPEHARIQLRIGVHAGPVIAYGGRPYGDVINIAARLQSTGPRGGLMMSTEVAERCSGRLRAFSCVEAVLAGDNIPWQLTAVAVQLR